MPALSCVYMYLASNYMLAHTCICIEINLSLKRMVVLFSFPLRNGLLIIGKMVLLTQVYMSVSKEPGAIWGLLLHSPIFNPLSDGKFMAKIFLYEKYSNG